MFSSSLFVVMMTRMVSSCVLLSFIHFSFVSRVSDEFVLNSRVSSSLWATIVISPFFNQKYECKCYKPHCELVKCIYFSCVTIELSAAVLRLLDTLSVTHTFPSVDLSCVASVFKTSSYRQKTVHHEFMARESSFVNGETFIALLTVQI